MNNLEQGSDAWLAMRRDYVGGSDASVIMGTSKWATPRQLYDEKMGLIEPRPMNWAMARGIELEPEARAAFCREHNVEVYPCVRFSNDHSFMMASLDGMSTDGKVMVEIKVPSGNDHDTALSGEIPPHYHAQLQHQLCVTGLDRMYYYSYRDGEGVSVLVERDDDYIAKLVKAEAEFYQCMKTKTPPPLTDRDYKPMDTAIWEQYGQRLAEIDATVKALTEERNAIRDEMIKQADGHSAKGSGVTLTKMEIKGSVDYSAIPELRDVDLDPYRKPSRTSWRLTVSS